MELNVTPLFADKLDFYMISNSVANLGSDAAKITWENALEAADQFPLATDKNQQELRDYFKSYGAWDAQEVASWSLRELSALCWQEAAADVSDNWADLEELPDSGEIEGSKIFCPSDGKFYMYFGT
jgi:hypothetical protein